MFGLGYVDPALISAVLNRPRYGAMGNFGYPRMPGLMPRPASFGPSQGLSPAAMLARMKAAGSYYGLSQPAPVASQRPFAAPGSPRFSEMSGNAAAQPYLQNVRERMLQELFAKNNITPESGMRRP